jgi:asparagine synthetase B (glutamine-hydrolysing)
VNDRISYPQIGYADISTSDIIDRALGGAPLPHGHYAFACQRGQGTYLVRDPLGCNKLFFGYARDGSLVVANRIVEAWRGGVPLSAIASCPPGQVIEVSAEGMRRVAATDIAALVGDPDVRIDTVHEATRPLLDRTFAWIAHAFAGSRFVVSLSGGLDSSVIASFAAAHLSDVTAASFTYLNDDDLARYALGAPVDELASASEDFRHAAQVAAALGIPLLPVVRPRQAVATAIRASVHLCQDWRDFNVHCATVNLFLAQDIRAAFPDEKVVVLTGDLMNEFVCDYREERVGDTVYYKLPRIPVDKRRKHLVRGLDAGDREIGIFRSCGLDVCQPFVVLAEHYMRLPAALLDQPDIKWTLNGPLLAPAAAKHVGRAKTRAQVGGGDMGTLGIYHALGVGEAQLRRVWQEQFPGETARSCDDLIQFGRYRMPCYTAGT